MDDNLQVNTTTFQDNNGRSKSKNIDYLLIYYDFVGVVWADPEKNPAK